MGYSFLQNPWYSLALEATGVVQYYLLWVAVIEHSHDIAPEGLTSTIITISGAIHFSIGKSSSGIIARTIMDTFGGRFAFRFYACICLAVAILYSIYVYFRRRHSSTKHTLNPSPQKTKSLPIENGNGEKK
ncbi:MFS_1_like domain-containing protein [Caerostris extrusa]|uniref:MFS_1_like domain-containing protein n=1 Tax=Caerostris extrusa TaxID=172846 RepID=A0AAV4MIC7_CAEEX|nr:MFS_1_like domain-containing protein [Caerostris extrusa]